jgi:hypothetical protein
VRKSAAAMRAATAGAMTFSACRLLPMARMKNGTRTFVLFNFVIEVSSIEII